MHLRRNDSSTSALVDDQSPQLTAVETTAYKHQNFAHRLTGGATSAQQPITRRLNRRATQPIKSFGTTFKQRSFRVNPTFQHWPLFTLRNFMTATVTMHLTLDAAALDAMKYAELQKLAKKIGVKANMKVT